MSKRKAEEDLLGHRATTTLEIKRLEDLTPSVAREYPHVQTLKISCFVKATHRSGLPANGMSICHETALRIPYFLILFPELKEMSLGGYTVESERYREPGEEGVPWWFSLSKFAVRRHHDDVAEDNLLDSSIKVIFDLVIKLCDAYKTGFLHSRVKIIGLFDTARWSSRYSLLCEDKSFRRDNTWSIDKEPTRDGTSCRTCRRICQSINVQQALELKCAETPGSGEVNNLSRLEFIGCQLCLTSKTKFELISSRGDCSYDLICAHLLNILSDENKISSAWYACDDGGSPLEGGKKRGEMLWYSCTYEGNDSTVADELKALWDICKGRISSSDVVNAIVSNSRANLYMIDGKVFISSGTWSYLGGAITDEQDRQKFEVIDVEKYDLWCEDMVDSCEPWRGDS